MNLEAGVEAKGESGENQPNVVQGAAAMTVGNGVPAGAAPAGATATPRAGEKRLRVLILTKVFPSAIEPVAAAFNRQQFAALSRFADIELLVPVQWFPGAELAGPRTGAGKLARLPSFEWTDGLFVRHPRVFHL